MQALREERDAINSRLGGRFQIIKENPDYSAVFEEVRKVDPVLVIAGSEFGVELAARLSADLGLLEDPPERIPAMTQKDAMHEALKDYGIRYIRGKVIASLEEAEAFCDEIGTANVVVKPSRGAGTQGVYMCSKREEVLSAVKGLTAHESGDFRILIQERITGTEYIVNTASCNGKHRLISIKALCLLR